MEKSLGDMLQEALTQQQEEQARQKEEIRKDLFLRAADSGIIPRVKEIRDERRTTLLQAKRIAEEERIRGMIYYCDASEEVKRVLHRMQDMINASLIS